MYKLKKVEDQESARMYTIRKKLGLIKPVEKPNDTITEEEVQSTSCSFTTKQSISRSVNKAQKALPASARKIYEVIGKLTKKN